MPVTPLAWLDMAINKAKQVAIDTPQTPMDRVDVAARQNSKALHRLYRQLIRERKRQSLRLASQALIGVGLRPLTSLLRAWEATRAYGPEVTRLAGVPMWRQFLHQWLIAVRFGFRSDTYYRYRLYRLDKIVEAELYFPLNVNIALREHLYQRLKVDASPLVDKRIFQRICIAHDLPVAAIVAEFTAGDVRAWPDGGEVSLPRHDLFSKPVDSLCGEGVARWIWQEDDRYRGENGQTLTADELCDHFAALSYGGTSYLLQQRLTNHPAIVTLGPSALCTARIITCRELHGPPEHLASIFRMPPEWDAAPADNFALGGFASPIDEASGTLGVAVRKDLQYAAVDYQVHPGSGRSFDSYSLPRWQEVLELCLRAHRVFSEFPSVGWDIAITPEGPILLEGNHDWDVVLAQQPGSRPLGRTRFVDSYRSFHTQTTSDRP